MNAEGTRELAQGIVLFDALEDRFDEEHEDHDLNKT